MVWYSHFFKNFPQFVVIHTVKGFGVVSHHLFTCEASAHLRVAFSDPHPGAGFRM